jgi:hypothetical protein
MIFCMESAFLALPQSLVNETKMFHMISKHIFHRYSVEWRNKGKSGKIGSIFYNFPIKVLISIHIEFVLRHWTLWSFLLCFLLNFIILEAMRWLTPSIFCGFVWKFNGFFHKFYIYSEMIKGIFLGFPEECNPFQLAFYFFLLIIRFFLGSFEEYFPF